VRPPRGGVEHQPIVRGRADQTGQEVPVRLDRTSDGGGDVAAVIDSSTAKTFVLSARMQGRGPTERCRLRVRFAVLILPPP